MQVGGFTTYLLYDYALETILGRFLRRRHGHVWAFLIPPRRNSTLEGCPSKDDGMDYYTTVVVAFLELLWGQNAKTSSFSYLIIFKVVRARG
jgi:hypothetical protein